MNSTKIRPVALAVALGALLLVVSALAPALASAEVKYRTETVWAPSPLLAGEEGTAFIFQYNAGDTSASGNPLLTLNLPSGITFSGKAANGFGQKISGCSGTGTETAVCPLSFGLEHFGKTSMAIGLNVGPGVSGTHTYTTSLSGAGATSPSFESGQVTVGSKPYGFGFLPGSAVAGSFDPAGVDDNRAGAHPFRAIGKFDVNLTAFTLFPNNPPEPASAGGKPKDIVTELPAGFVANPTAVAQCPWKDFDLNCPAESQIGVAHLGWNGDLNPPAVGVYNMVPLGKLPAQIAFKIQGYNIVGTPEVTADSDYSVRLRFHNIPEVLQPLRVKLEVWGDPSDPVNDLQRCSHPNIATGEASCNGYSAQGGGPSDSVTNNPRAFVGPRIPFVTNPTSCAQTPEARFHFSLWANPAPDEDFSDPRWSNIAVKTLDLIGCDQLPFEPTIELDPTTKQADSPTGLDVHLKVPQDGLLEPEGLATAHLKKATAVLPEGVGFNAGIADGLAACSPAQIGLVSTPGASPIRFNNVEPSCPAGSKIGTGEVISPLLEDHLHGEVFLASQDANPFASNYAIYVVVREPSVLVKLAGKVEPDPVTGKVTVTFDRNPQLPFDHFIMRFYGGPRAALATPLTCGTFSSKTEITPWSAKDPDNPTAEETVTITDPFTIDSSPAGDCVSDKSQLPLNIGLSAGSQDPIAGARSPFSMRITRPDANQELEKLEISPPPGFVGSLRGIPYCSEAQIASAAARDSGKDELGSPSCPSASQLGTTNVGAGAGSAPFYAPGKLYLAGPYKGAKLSVVVITPAVAGPFDLGNVVVRSKLEIDPLTARITAITDPLPKMIEGVPLRIRDIRIDLDRPGWAMNPTNCEAMSVDITAYGTGGAVSEPSNRYQVGGCEKLGFKPKLSIRFKGGTKRGDHPALLATLSTRDGDANIARVAVTLPRSAFLDQAHIRTICTRVQYAANACPKGATYGFAEATTELLDDPLKGNVILRSSDNKLPDLVGALKGVADIEAVGRIDSIKGGIRNTFEVVPDAPFDAFTLRMQGGKKGLVVNSQNLCAKTHRATVKLTAHNGRRYNFRPKVVATGCKKAKRKGQKRRGAGRGG